MASRRTLYITAIGVSANSFLKGHFRTLAAHDYRVALATSPDERARQATTETGIELFPVPMRVDIAPLADLISIARLIRVIRRYAPDVVHAHMSKAGLLGMVAGWLTRTRHRLYHNHGMAYFSATGNTRRLLGLSERLACRLATQVVFCSESTRDEAVRLGLCPPDKAVVIGSGTISGVDTDRFSRTLTTTDRDMLCESLGLPTRGFLVGFVGRLVPHKGLGTLLSAWRRLPENTRTQAALVIAGAHQNDALYRRLCDAMRNDESIRYLGRQEHIETIYQLFDVLVLPSWHEGFPYSVLEAQSLGVPAIVTRVTGNVDAVVHDETGLHVPVDDPDALAEAIAGLLASPARRRSMGERATQRALAEFSQERVMGNLLDFYASLD